MYTKVTTALSLRKNKVTEAISWERGIVMRLPRQNIKRLIFMFFLAMTMWQFITGE